MTSNFKKPKISEELAAILDAALDDVLITDGQGNVILVSPKFEEMYGVSDKEIIGQNVLELEKQGVFKPSITKLVMEKKQKVTMIQKTKNGGKMIVSAVPIKDADGAITEVVSFSRDVTELMELQEQYKRLERKAEFYSDRLNEQQHTDIGSDLFIGKTPWVTAPRGFTRLGIIDFPVELSGKPG